VKGLAEKVGEDIVSGRLILQNAFLTKLAKDVCNQMVQIVTAHLRTLL
jgi:hypothetical protein